MTVKLFSVFLQARERQYGRGTDNLAVWHAILTIVSSNLLET
jgi:hypothetical protein